MRRSPPAGLWIRGAILTVVVLVLGYLLIEGVGAFQEAQVCENPPFEEVLLLVWSDGSSARGFPLSHLQPFFPLLPWVVLGPGKTPRPSEFHAVAPPLQASSLEFSSHLPLRL